MQIIFTYIYICIPQTYIYINVYIYIFKYVYILTPQKYNINKIYIIYTYSKKNMHYIYI